MMAERAKLYPEEYRDPEGGSRFRHRLLARLEALDPHKAVSLQKVVDEIDADDFEKAVTQWEKATKKAEEKTAERAEKRKEVQKQWEKDTAEAQSQATYREAPEEVESVEERLGWKGLEPEKDPKQPPAPKMPARYNLIRGELPDLKELHEDLFEQGEEPEKDEEPEELQDSDLEFEAEAPKRKSPPPLPKGKTKEASMGSLASRVLGRYLAFSSCAF